MSSTTATTGQQQGESSSRTLFGTVDFGEEKEAVRKLLEQKLPAEYLSTRVGAGKSRFTYIESWRAIEIANSIFGFDGWSSSVVDITPDYVEESGGKFKVGVTAIVRVTLKNGSFHEDVGFGMAENRCKGSAIENAKKEAVSDARKRALRVYGNALGNSVYDHEYIEGIKPANAQRKGIAAAIPISYDQTHKSVISTSVSTTTPNVKKETSQIYPGNQTVQQPVQIRQVQKQVQPQIQQINESFEEFPIDNALLEQLNQFDDNSNGSNNNTNVSPQPPTDVTGEPPTKRGHS